MLDALQILGATAILLPFALAQFGRVRTTSPSYLWLNFVGSALLGVLAVIGEQWGFVLLEGTWAIVSAWSLIRLARGLPLPAPQ